MTAIVKTGLGAAAFAAALILDASAIVSGARTIRKATNVGLEFISKKLKKEDAAAKPAAVPEKDGTDTSWKTMLTNLHILKSNETVKFLLLDTLRYCAFAGLAHVAASYLGVNASLAQRIASFVPSSK